MNFEIDIHISKDALLIDVSDFRDVTTQLSTHQILAIAHALVVFAENLQEKAEEKSKTSNVIPFRRK